MNRINYRKLIDENYEDALFAKLMDGHAEIEGARLLEENERLKNDPDFYLPDGLDERCMNTINNIFKAKRRKKRKKRVTAVFKRVAVAILICAALFTGLMCTASAFRDAVLRLFTTESIDKTELQILDVMEQNPTNENDCGPMVEIPESSNLPTWLPEGYILSSLSFEDNRLKAIYIDKSDNQISYKEFPNSSATSIDTEDADETEMVSINDNKGVFVSKGSNKSLSWGDTNRNVIIKISSETISKKEMLQMARSIEK